MATTSYMKPAAYARIRGARLQVKAAGKVMRAMVLEPVDKEIAE